MAEKGKEKVQRHRQGQEKGHRHGSKVSKAMESSEFCFFLDHSHVEFIDPLKAQYTVSPS